MTNHSLPTGPAGSEGDSEKKKWGYKRQQFDAVVSKTRFNGAIDGLVSGQIDVRGLLSILDELNASNQRGRYMAEVLALKQESRRLATVGFSERVAEFLVEGSRRIPWLSDGLASQLAVALASAADNPAYLDTVNTAVSNLLLDLDRPLKSDTRNFLRALTDKIDATRRLQEARGLLATVPSVYPPAIPAQLANAESPVPPSVESPDEYDSELDPSELQSEADAFDDVTSRQGRGQVIDEYLEPTEDKPAPTLATQRTLIMPVGVATSGMPQAPEAQKPLAQTSAEKPLAQASAQKLSSPKVARAKTLIGVAPQGALDEAPPVPIHAITPSEDLPVAVESAGATQSGLGDGHPKNELPPTGDSASHLTPVDVPSDSENEPVKIPTSRIPIWLIAMAVGGVVAGGAGLWLLFRDSGKSGLAPETSASALSAAAGSAAPKAAKRKGGKSTKSVASAAPSAPALAPAPPPVEPAPPVPPPVAQPPVPPPPAAVVPPPAPPAAVAPTPRIPKASTAPILRTPTAPAAISKQPAAITRAPVVAPKPAASKPVVEPPAPKPEREPPKPKVTASTPVPDAPALPTTPKPSRTIDDILVELLQVPNDPASIEAKAYEVARVVARAPKADAEHILRRLIPEEVLAGSETVDTRALEPVRRVVALTLKKVALDKDDNRAALAIDSLGEWAKLRKHGAAAKLTLDELAEERVVLSRPARLRALERVQARLGISNVGEN